MSSLAIVADSGCDLPATLLERHDIRLVSLIARFGAYELADTLATRAEFWERYESGQTPQSAAPSAGDWAEAYDAALCNYDSVLAITITGKHSSTFNSAVLGAAGFGERVSVFDSWSLSLGEGLLVLRAAEMAAAGAESPAIMAELAGLRSRLRLWFLLDTLEAVQRGGRLAPIIVALKQMSSLLAIKPILTVREGVIGLDGVARSLQRGVRTLVDRTRSLPVQVAGVGHTRQTALAARTAGELAAATGLALDSILLAEAGPALGVHAGPGAIGLGVILS